MKFKDQHAIYLQIADHVCEQILKKELKESERIPSVREFSENVEVNPNTLVRSYAFLEDKGVIYKERGMGYFVSKDAYKKVLALQKERFLKEDLPSIFKALELLGIEFDELKKMYTKSKREKNS